MVEILVEALMLAGAAFILVGGIGLLRMPDAYMRISAVAKVLTLGIGCLLLAAAFHFQDASVTTRTLVVIVFFFLTSPVSAHMMGRAAYLAKTPMWRNTSRDELRGRYDLREGTLNSPTPDSPRQGGPRQG